MANQEEMEAFNAQSEGVVKKGVRVAFFKGPEPDTLATKGCPRGCDTQHPHLKTCVIDGCPPNCTLTHAHGNSCPNGCQDRHHNYICQDRHHVKPAGIQKFKEIIYLKKVIPGDTLNVIVRPMHSPEDEQEYPKAWQDYLDGVESTSGTPISILPFLNEAQKAEFRAANCHFAEDIANMPDVMAQKFMGINDIKRKVTDFLAAASGKATDKIAALEKRLKELEAKR
jgi:hypothetical protein